MAADPKMKFLVVDDFSTMRRIIKNLLRDLGFNNTQEADDGNTGLPMLQTGNFDFLITDWNMPGMTGIDLARRILQIRPEMPIILCTGYSTLISEDKAKAAGIKGFAYKPLAKNEIGELIRKVLDRKES